jgi:hypothetical protein
MNPTVMAAAIGVSGTVIVGVAGFGAAIWNTRRTIAHARESRIWDRRSETYVDALVAVNFRQARRKQQTQTGPVDEATQRALSGLAADKDFDWHMLESRLQAFSSNRVFTAVQDSSTASERAMTAFRAWQAEDKKGEYFSEANLETRRVADEALESAEAADDAVVELIRTELQGRGQPLGDWQAIPHEPDSS